MINKKEKAQIIDYYLDKYYLIFCIFVSIVIGYFYKLDFFLKLIPFLENETFPPVVFYSFSVINIIVSINFIVIPNLYKNYRNSYLRNLILSSISLTTAYIIVLFINIRIHEIFLPKSLSILIYTLFLYLFHFLNFNLSYIINKTKFSNILYNISILFYFFSYLLYLSKDMYIRKILSIINLVNYEIDSLVLIWQNNIILPSSYYIFFIFILFLFLLINIFKINRKQK